MPQCRSIIILSTIAMQARTTKTNISTFSNLSRNENQLYVSQYEHIVIYCAQLYEQYLMLCSKNINIYDMDQMKKVQQIDAKTHAAAFVPYTNYVVYADSKDGEYRNLVIYDYSTASVKARVTLNFIIEEIKTSRRTIALSSLQHIYVLHYPSLKPIYQGFAGDGLKICFNISRQGFTLAHTALKKGELLVRNFTNIHTKKILVDIEASERKKSTKKYYRPTQSVISEFNRSSTSDEDGGVKKQIRIQAHLDNIAMIRLSPNGYRVVTASIKGAIIRMYSCLSGQLMTEYRMSDSISPIVDVQFLPRGTQIICLNENNEINLFYTKMLDLEKLSQSQKKGYQIYEQENPTSLFSFLGFASTSFRNEFPFASYKLDTKGIEYKEQKEKIEAEAKTAKQNEKKATIPPEIKESHQEHIEEDHQNQNVPDTPQVSQIKQSQISQDLKLDKSQNSDMRKSFNHSSVNEQDSSMHGSALGSAKFPEIVKIMKEPVVEGRKPYLSIDKKSSGNSTRFKAMRTTSVKGRSTTIKSAGKLGKKNSETVGFGQKTKAMYFKGIVNFGTTTNIRVFQSRYFFQLKYDPFNGGQMVEKSSMNLLKESLFSDL